MTECAQRAVLIVTRSVEGTATSVAKTRVELMCRLPEGHDGPHQDTQRGETWEAQPGRRATLLRHEDGT